MGEQWNSTEADGRLGAMKALMAVAVVMVGCGPYGSSRLGQTCDAGQQVNHCASPTTYAACDTSSGFAVWREYPCQDTCAEGNACSLGGSKAGSACPASWNGAGECKAARLAVVCLDGGWVPSTCDECSNQGCLACACASAASLAGRVCDSSKDRSVCEVDGKVTTCDRGFWRQYPCNACRAGQPLANCDPSNGTCSCD